MGVDGANTGLVTNTTALPDLSGTYNVGVERQPVAAARRPTAATMWRGSGSSTRAATSPIPPTPTPRCRSSSITRPRRSPFTSPTAGQVITSLTNGVLKFTITTSKNIDLTHFNAVSIVVINAGPDGILGTADDVTIPIDPNSITVTYLDAGTGGPGAEQITFSSLAGTTLTNNLYQLTLLNTGADAVRDIAGNLLANPVTQTFAVAVPSLAKTCSSKRGPTPPRPPAAGKTPYATIGAAMTAATAGDVIAVLPGVYQEQVTMKPVRASCSRPATEQHRQHGLHDQHRRCPLDDHPGTVRGEPLRREPTPRSPRPDSRASPGLTTEIAGFTIASPLVVEPGDRNDQPECRRRQHHEFQHHPRQRLRDRRRHRRRR